MKKIIGLVIFSLLFASVHALAARDEIPGNMLYMDVYLINKDTGQEIETARFEARRGMGAQNLSNCKKTAKEEAKKMRLENWDYYCCTVTADNPCASKVKK